MEDYLVFAITPHVSMIKSIFKIIHDVSQDDVNIIFMLNEPFVPKNILVKKSKNKKSKTDSSSDSNSDSNSDSSSDSNSDSNSDSDSDSKIKNKKNKKKAKNIVENKSANDGMVLRVMSSEQITIACVRVYSEIFTEFIVKNKKFSFWLNVKDILTCLDCMETVNCNLTLSVSVKEPNKMKLKWQKEGKVNRVDNYTVTFTEPDNNIPPIPITECDYEVDIPANVFKTICGNASKFSDSIRIICSNTRILFKFKQNSDDDYWSYGDGDDGIIISPRDETKNVRFSGGYLLSELLRLKNNKLVTNSMKLNLTGYNSKNLLVIKHTIEINDRPIGKMDIFISPQIDEITIKDSENLYKDIVPILKKNIK